MNQTYNIYCDESCHLENDRQQVMVLGAVWCPLGTTHDISVDIRKIKADYGMKSGFEIKWSKVSPAKKEMYLNLIDYFFNNDDLCFRALIVPDKSKLQHKALKQSHDDWYYKMYFNLLKVILSPKDRYRIYIDIKDTRSGSKIKKLREILSNSMYDFSQQIIEWVQTVHSHEVEIMQLTDLLIGAISYVNRGLSTSEAKANIVDRIQKRSGYDLTRTTLLRENKVNLFRWHPSEVQG
ncbi:MAG TPA: DUF3800 domain-containing protein [Syntrophorhabdaceae bacterium]|nr:DUF3800 domain-containing protein [Syntrophorhabdaceae bacterium]HOG39989.1 DUF3800 domain-containing protein [Syntrophorhabdaceae bacterium]